MSRSQPKLLVTGATGHLGRLVIKTLLRTTSADRIVAAVRDPDKAADLAAQGVEVRKADYVKPETLDAALQGIDRLLLISSSEIGQRAAQHRNVIAAAKRAGVGFIAYTSVLKADISPLSLAEEHRQTEAMLRESGIPFAVLRNGWYSENHTAALPSALAQGAQYGSAGDGRFSTASRQDYAEAAAAVLLAHDDQNGRVYELAGDASFSLSEYAAELSRQSGQSVAYRDLPEADYKAALLGAGLPETMAELLANSDTGAKAGALEDGSRTLSALIGRPTTPMNETVAAALKG